MKLQKQNDFQTIETLKVEGTKTLQFYVDIVKDNKNNYLESYFYCADYGKKVMMFGIPSEAKNKKEESFEVKNFEELVSNNLKHYMVGYYEQIIGIESEV